jgi:hypothetical protein
MTFQAAFFASHQNPERGKTKIIKSRTKKSKIEKFMTTSDLIKNVSKTLPQGKPLVLVFQGGGALGAYQWGVYQALTECQVHPRVQDLVRHG